MKSVVESPGAQSVRGEGSAAKSAATNGCRDAGSNRDRAEITTSANGARTETARTKAAMEATAPATVVTAAATTAAVAAAGQGRIRREHAYRGNGE
jgi:hypothetical protein